MIFSNSDKEINSKKLVSYLSCLQIQMCLASAEFINTLGMPLLVALIGLILWIVSITKRSQKMREDMA